ncbi:MspA family porin [Nocardia terpenica]|uniref:Porin n=1 Tax=Nocardia terpenica TaxID=455432 RepID=A0A6G9Z9I5_9NOCA|nr:MspA family porin [Nocardia terpenica]QIS21836.1 porin [Nocardia terpenica]
MINRKSAARAAGVGAAATMALGLFSTGAANADTFVQLPGGEITQTLVDGTTVTVRLVNETANINPSMGDTPLHRNVWVSGRAEVETSQGKGGKIYPGYIVACQVNIAGGQATGNGGGKTDWEGKKPDVNVGAGGSLNLGPGRAGQYNILDLEDADDFGQSEHLSRSKFSGTHGSVTWADETMAINGCAGYAQARAFVKVKVDTDAVKGIVTLWGQPFSIG